LSESDGIAAGYPELMDSSLTDISPAIDNKNDPRKKAWLLQNDSIGETEVTIEKRSMKRRFPKS